jgi:[acyl-carrier-protein] S-malonyltransferase
MGRDLADASRVARQTFEQADEALGMPLSRVAWAGPEEELTATSNAQAAILVHSIAVWRLVREELGDVALAAGHSLGEFSAYVAAGAIDFADGVRLVRRRGELMQRACLERPGTMVAVVHPDPELIERLCAEASAEGGACVPANYNSPGQIVISGDAETVARTVELARAAGVRRTLPLNVSGAFHSPLMRSAADDFAAELAAVGLRRPAFPIVSNVTAQPVTEPAEARRLLLEQLTAPVRWTDTVNGLIAAGVAELIEIGPGHVLAKLAKRTAHAATVRSIGKWEEVEASVVHG